MFRSFVIKSKHGNFEVLVDEEDWEKISQYGWSISKNKNYVRVESRINRKLVRLHRFILGLTPEDKRVVDHINRNPLDNRKCNLRIAETNDLNLRNCSAKPNKTGYRGVYKRFHKYHACISVNNKTVHIGKGFDTAEEAARARDEYALKVSGEFAILNFDKKERS